MQTIRKTTITIVGLNCLSALACALGASTSYSKPISIVFIAFLAVALVLALRSDGFERSADLYAVGVSGTVLLWTPILLANIVPEGISPFLEHGIVVSTSAGAVLLLAWAVGPFLMGRQQ